MGIFNCNSSGAPQKRITARLDHFLVSLNESRQPWVTTCLKRGSTLPRTRLTDCTTVTVNSNGIALETGYSAAQVLKNLSECTRKRTIERATGGVLVSATAELLGDSRNIDFSLTA